MNTSQNRNTIFIKTVYIQAITILFCLMLVWLKFISIILLQLLLKKLSFKLFNIVFIILINICLINAVGIYMVTRYVSSGKGDVLIEKMDTLLKISRNKIKHVYNFLYVQSVIHHLFLNVMMLLILWLIRLLISAETVTAFYLILGVLTIVLFFLVYYLKEDIIRYLSAVSRYEMFVFVNYCVWGGIVILLIQVQEASCTGTPETPETSGGIRTPGAGGTSRTGGTTGTAGIAGTGKTPGTLRISLPPPPPPHPGVNKLYQMSYQLEQTTSDVVKNVRIKQNSVLQIEQRIIVSEILHKVTQQLEKRHRETVPLHDYLIKDAVVDAFISSPRVGFLYQNQSADRNYQIDTLMHFYRNEYTSSKEQLVQLVIKHMATTSLIMHRKDMISPEGHINKEFFYQNVRNFSYYETMNHEFIHPHCSHPRIF